MVDIALAPAQIWVPLGALGRVRDGDCPIIAAWSTVAVAHAVSVFVAARALEHVGSATGAATLVDVGAPLANVRVACRALSPRRAQRCSNEEQEAYAQHIPIIGD